MESRIQDLESKAIESEQIQNNKFKSLIETQKAEIEEYKEKLRKLEDELDATIIKNDSLNQSGIMNLKQMEDEFMNLSEENTDLKYKLSVLKNQK